MPGVSATDWKVGASRKGEIASPGKAYASAVCAES